MKLSSCLLLTFVALAACISCVSAQVDRQGLCIGTNAQIQGPSRCDVVNNGIRQQNWDNAPKFAGASSPSLFVEIDPLRSPGHLTQLTKFNYITQVPSAVAFWTLPNNNGNTQPVSEQWTVNATTQSLNGQLICSEQGWSTFTIQVTFSPPLVYNEIDLTFQKQCVFPLMGVGTWGSRLVLPPFDSNVIHQNAPTNSFANFIATQTTQTMSFYPFLEVQQSDPSMVNQPFFLVIGADQPQYLTVTPTLQTGWQGFAQQYDVAPITVSFQCNQGVGVWPDVTVQGILSFNWNTTINFSFMYRCNTLGPAPGLNVGSQYGQADIMSNGRMVAPWNESFSFIPDQTFVVQMWMNSPTTTVPYSTSFFVENSQNYELIEVGKQTGTLTSSAPEAADFLSLVCHQNGMSHALIRLNFGQYDPAQLQFAYSCSKPVFNVGTQSNTSDVMYQNVARPGKWQSHYHGDTDSVKFWVSLDSSNLALSNGFSFQVFQVDQDGPLSSAQIDPPNGFTSKMSWVPVTLNFNCQPGMESYNNPINIILNQGWDVPLSWTVTKDCVPEPNSSSWTAAGIFFFVMFWIILTFCVCGCVLNKFRFGKSGLAIIPGAKTVEGWIDGCRGIKPQETRWTPQEDETGSSSNYQTNL